MISLLRNAGIRYPFTGRGPRRCKRFASPQSGIIRRLRHPSETPMLRSGSLPSTLPDDPLPTVQAWLADARERKVQPNPDAMVVATATPGRQAFGARRALQEADRRARVTSCFSRTTKAARGRNSPQIRASQPCCTGTQLARQVRLEGRVVRCPAGRKRRILPRHARSTAASAHGPACRASRSIHARRC